MVEEEGGEAKTTHTLDKEGTRVDLKCHFVKPYSEYSCILIYKNDIGRDVRYYKLKTSVSMSPQYVALQLTAKAREQASIKIPISNVPCDCILEDPHPSLILHNFNKAYNSAEEILATFSPKWMMEHNTRIITENSKSLTQVIYDISVKAI